MPKKDSTDILLEQLDTNDFLPNSIYGEAATEIRRLQARVDILDKCLTTRNTALDHIHDVLDIVGWGFPKDV